MLLYLKLTLLTGFVLLTLLGLAAPNLQVLLLGLGALTAALLLALWEFARRGGEPASPTLSTF